MAPAWRFRFTAAAVLLGACSGSPNAAPGSSGGAAGDAGQGAGGAAVAGSGAAGSATAGSSTAGSGAGTANAGTTAGGVASSGGEAPSTGGTGGAAAGAAGVGGAELGGAAGASPFACNQIIGMTLAREWFQAGFESSGGIINERWQLKAREHGYITEWSNPSSDFWNEPPQSACSTGSTSPDHVVLVVLSWNPACCTAQAEWEAQVEGAVTTLSGKYPRLKRIDLMTVIRGPGNQNCPTPPAANEYIAMPAELDAALAASAAKHPSLVHVAPPFEAPDCASFNGGGPHLTTSGNMAAAKNIAAHFQNLQ